MNYCCPSITAVVPSYLANTAFFINFSVGYLPKHGILFVPKMSTSPDGSSVFLTFDHSVYKLNPQGWQWENLSRSLPTSRNFHVQLSVPEESLNC